MELAGAVLETHIPCITPVGEILHVTPASSLRLEEPNSV
jgi:hypothetical protein